MTRTSAPARARGPTGDEEALVFFGGPIHTLSDLCPTPAAVGVRGEFIVAAGDRSTVEAALTAGDGRPPRPVDLRGAVLLPGFIDAHTHLGSYGLSLNLVELDTAGSVEEACRRVSERAALAGPGRWIRGAGWNKGVWADDRFPTRHDLDRAAPRNPAALISKDHHSWWLNTEALRLVGISDDTPDPPGGEIERDDAGRPTGILKENAGALVWNTVEQPTPEEYQACLRKAVAAANARGLVGIHDMEGRETFRACQVLDSRGELTLRVWMYMPDAFLPHLSAIGLESGFGGPYLRIAGIKVFLDGALGSQTADLLEPYEGSVNQGISTMSGEDFDSLVARAAAAGLPVAVHAIGDRANRKALDVFEANLAVSAAAGLRQRIEHAQLFHPDDLPRVARLNVVASMQPLHAPSDRDIAEKHWGRRVGGGYAWKSLLRTGARLAFGSDVPVETLDPLKGLYAAVTRRHPDDPGREGWRPEEALTPMDALWAYTAGAAWAVGAEAETGTLEPGKRADLVVLSWDVTRGDPEAIRTTEVVATVVGGRFVHGGI